ncbi:MAG: ISKra4 family transposase [Nitrospiraceae bacterium]
MRPTLAARPPSIVQIEREVVEQFRPQMCQALQHKLDELAASQSTLLRPTCCNSPVPYHDNKRVPALTRFGWVKILVYRYRCHRCQRDYRPLLDFLEVEPGKVSGSLARLLGLLGVVVPYELAAQLALLFFGVHVNAMTVWRAVQRLGESAARHVEGLAAYHEDSRSQAPSAPTPPDVVMLGVDGCALGMQVRKTRRRRKTSLEVLPPLSPVEEGHFREVKTAVLLLPAERIEPSPGRHCVLRRVLVTCLGDADAIFSRAWAQLRELGWLGANTVVVIVADGSEWIWNRAIIFNNRCEILDFWHAMEYAWKYARMQFGENSRWADRFTHRIAKDLRAGKVHEVIARLKTLQPVSYEAREALEAIIKYYTDNASRMQYDEYLRLGYGIGSGAVESAHKQVVHARLRQAGMRWSEDGARRLLALRLLLLNGNWAQVDRLRMVPIAA